MFTLPRTLIVWRLVRLVAPLAICGLLVALLALLHTAHDHSRSHGSLDRPVGVARQLQHALTSEIVAARPALTAALLSGGLVDDVPAPWGTDGRPTG